MSETKPTSRKTGGLSRRSFVIGIPFVLAACQSTATRRPMAAAPGPIVDSEYASMYGPIDTEPFPIAAIDLTRIDPKFYRRVVSVPFDIPNEPGTIVVDPPAHYLYLILEGGQAIRYGVGVGRDGFAWSGDAAIQAKREWPRWHPPKEMQARDPEAAKWPDGMPGGPRNPLGARALYLFQGKKDTLYRLHGTNQPWSIGKSLSSGCIRLLNHDIIDLYGRVPLGTKVTVIGNVQPDPQAVYGNSGAPADDGRANTATAPVPPADVHG
ncbi:L,D-transpeptidase [Prosthecomicrobium pneumaticum]|uniref:Lipoprotein-anchoring transpeptidase ErfK/SrfK n=1 Tax=Prosthecomicrobium pneumaticum TaxID=81895 RepID=A0A7W9FKQ2_9HYPH|nr:L,D-transpeptidase [Prosthecomicrobium pneumaticum]MBB5751079.1 lipoprotein-anchoring transpeptidase ErfK/SrfK [Prosthecomicrobium pneumaticum]